MEFLSPRLRFALWLSSRLESGLGVRAAVEEYRRSFGDEAGPFEVRDSRGLLAESLDLLIARGLKGEPVLEALRSLIQEMEFATQADLERHIQRLPVLVLLPLMFLILPAVTVVLFGPIFLRLMEEVQK